MKLILATRNPNKVREISELLSSHEIKVLSLDEFPNMGDIEEDGNSFRENAQKKAAVVCAETSKITLADDSGLEVDYLEGAPGVLSSRFAGADKDDQANNKKLLELMSGVPAELRTARFKCVMAIAVPDGWVYTAEGACEGIIAEEPRGHGGFGYDPLFYLPDYGRTMAELDLETKNRISHRSRALAGALDILLELQKIDGME
ncbi:MAG: Non-canonical purine NTP pyrophosphatase [Pelotomaculum thermopropionicum]|uniref:dITP/XTP pyrophosphatase n=1 Tax=Pelotomaculum thermopropionicum TaxID=110500 RepID=A0A101HQQ4_9FIRM|nr:MAG: Non-canonical purine NTP pyrophosphatase [Pelotomaculum thermopropionicum]